MPRGECDESRQVGIRCPANAATALRAVNKYPALCTPQLLAHHERDGLAILFFSELLGPLVAERLLQPDENGHAKLGQTIGNTLAVMNGIHFNRHGLLSANGIHPVPHTTAIHWLETWVTSAKRKLAHDTSFLVSSLIRETDRAINTLHTLGQTPTCLVHGDFSPKNLIVLDDEHIGIIDWEYAKSFPGAFNICRYLIDTHAQSLHVRAVWSAWAARGRPSGGGA
jgi:aminoglycoside/choline kinase family phosphotransferase